MNSLAHYFLPQWISVAFLIAIPLPFILISFFVRRATVAAEHRVVYPAVISFFTLYLFYIAFASYAGWFDRVSLPPRVLLLTTFPFAFLLFMVVGRSKIYQIILKGVAIEGLVRLHLFRLLGVFFILLAIQEALPKPFAFIAGIGDMVAAIGSIFVARAIQDKKSYAKKLTYYWNVFGTVDILFTAIAANVLTKISIDTGAMGVDTLAIFPFCIIPAFAPPVILFLHVAIFKKLQALSA